MFNLHFWRPLLLLLIFFRFLFILLLLLLMLLMSLFWPCLLLLITLRSTNVNLRLLKAKVEFLWWVGGVDGGVCKVIFVSNPTSVLRLCCFVVGVVTITVYCNLQLPIVGIRSLNS